MDDVKLRKNQRPQASLYSESEINFVRKKLKKGGKRLTRRRRKFKKRRVFTVCKIGYLTLKNPRFFDKTRLYFVA